MKFNLYKSYGALNSVPIFSAFEQGLKNLGHEVSQDQDAIPVIWSVLWRGRMAPNKIIYESAKKRGLPVIILEVGNLKRNLSWRVSVDHINGQGIFGNDRDLDPQRHKKFNLDLEIYKEKRKKEILITLQHTDGLQWQGQPSVQSWLTNKILEVRKFSDRPIVVRPHPRSNFLIQSHDYVLQKPRKLSSTYDEYDIDYEFHCVINHNSGTTVQAAIKGIPIICDSSALAYPVSESIENLEKLQYINRQEWFLSLCHTEWFVDEIAKGIPLQRLERFLTITG